MHPILVRGAAREMRELCLTGLCVSSVQNLFKTHMGSDMPTGQSLGNSSVDHPLLPGIFLPEKRQGRRGTDMSNTDSIPTVNLSRHDQV